MKTLWPILILAFILLGSLFLLAGCATVAVPDFRVFATLPASGDGYFVKTVSEDEGRVKKEDWEKACRSPQPCLARALHIMPEDWVIFRDTILENCLTMECKNSVGILDNLFFTIDDQLKKLPPLK